MSAGALSKAAAGRTFDMQPALRASLGASVSGVSLDAAGELADEIESAASAFLRAATRRMEGFWTITHRPSSNHWRDVDYVRYLSRGSYRPVVEAFEAAYISRFVPLDESHKRDARWCVRHALQALSDAEAIRWSVDNRDDSPPETAFPPAPKALPRSASVVLSTLALIPDGTAGVPLLLGSIPDPTLATVSLAALDVWPDDRGVLAATFRKPGDPQHSVSLLAARSVALAMDDPEDSKSLKAFALALKKVSHARAAPLVENIRPLLTGPEKDAITGFASLPDISGMRDDPHVKTLEAYLSDVTFVAGVGRVSGRPGFFATASNRGYMHSDHCVALMCVRANHEPRGWASLIDSADSASLLGARGVVPAFGMPGPVGTPFRRPSRPPLGRTAGTAAPSLRKDAVSQSPAPVGRPERPPSGRTPGLPDVPMVHRLGHRNEVPTGLGGHPVRRPERPPPGRTEGLPVARAHVPAARLPAARAPATAKKRVNGAKTRVWVYGGGLGNSYQPNSCTPRDITEEGVTAMPDVVVPTSPTAYETFLEDTLVPFLTRHVRAWVHSNMHYATRKGDYVLFGKVDDKFSGKPDTTIPHKNIYMLSCTDAPDSSEDSEYPETVSWQTPGEVLPSRGYDSSGLDDASFGDFVMGDSGAKKAAKTSLSTRPGGLPKLQAIDKVGGEFTGHVTRARLKLEHVLFAKTRMILKAFREASSGGGRPERFEDVLLETLKTEDAAIVAVQQSGGKNGRVLEMRTNDDVRRMKAYSDRVSGFEFDPRDTSAAEAIVDAGYKRLRGVCRAGASLWVNASKKDTSGARGEYLCKHLEAAK